MTTRSKLGTAALLAGLTGFGCLPGQTSKNPISTKPEGTAPNCSYSGGISDGKPASSSACRPGTLPGTDPNQVVPLNSTGSPAQRFPFPGDSANPAAVPSAGTPNPAVPAPEQTNPASAAKRFPFPGQGAAETVPASAGGGLADRSNGPALQDAGSSGSTPEGAKPAADSSSSSSNRPDAGYSSSSAGPDLPDDDPNAPMPARRRAPRRKLPPDKKPLTPDEQAAEDVQIAGFYQNDGNYIAAYQRSKEAVSLVPDDPQAYVALGDAARKLGKLDEAKNSYGKALALDPVPKLRKAAEKALKEMSGG